MDFVSAIIGNLMGVVMMCLFAAGVMKVFQIATTLEEIKEGLADFRRIAKVAPLAPAAKPMSVPTDEEYHPNMPSGEDMLRALDRELGISPAHDLGAPPSVQEHERKLRNLRAQIEASRTSHPEKLRSLDTEIVEPGDRHA